jgi:hypothetical protein
VQKNACEIPINDEFIASSITTSRRLIWIRAQEGKQWSEEGRLRDHYQSADAQYFFQREECESVSVTAIHWWPASERIKQTVK